MSRPAPVLAAALAAALVGCGGGGGGSSATVTAGALDADPARTPPADPSYHNVPSVVLGATVSGGSVTFRTWNPQAASASVCLYADWNDPLASPAAVLSLTREDAGLWTSGPVALPAQGYYVYNFAGTYMLDPYARSMAQWRHTSSAAIPGDSIGKGAILDPGAFPPDGGWTAYAAGSDYFDGTGMKDTDGATPAPYPYASSRDAIVYEAGVRDFTVDPLLSAFAGGHAWGTFKGLVDLLPHIQRLGVTHVQLLCPLENYTYDQTRVGTRETSASQTTGANYNWGYDPQNWFTPSGMYSADPASPGARINELKTLVNEIHKQGMGVILDVVFNHTANEAVLGNAALPDYYYRSTAANGAGSRDVRSEAKMVRKLIVDAIVQWVRDYRVDGFRFDLMGDLDTQTVKAAYAAARDLNPHVLFLGEGWNGYYAGAGTDYSGAATFGADQAHAAQFAGLDVAMFSDSYRNILKNGYPSDGSAAFLSGQAESFSSLFSNVAGSPTNFAAGSTDRVVNYLTCHDNLCLYDVLAAATGGDDATLLRRARIGYAVLLTSQGLAFLHGGDEMFRSKATTAGAGAANTFTGHGRTFVANSYNASDAINMVAWSRVYAGDPLAAGFAAYDPAQPGSQLYAYTQGLIRLRRSTNAFRLADAAVAANLTALPAQGGTGSTLAFGYRAASTDGTGTYYVFHNADTSSRAFTVGASLAGAVLLADQASAGVTAIPSATGVTLSPDGLTVTLAPLTSAIYKL